MGNLLKNSDHDEGTCSSYLVLDGNTDSGR